MRLFKALLCSRAQRCAKIWKKRRGDETAGDFFCAGGVKKLNPTYLVAVLPTPCCSDGV